MQTHQAHSGSALFARMRRAVALAALLGLSVPLPALADAADPDAFGPALSSTAARPLGAARFESGRKARTPKPVTESLSMGRAVRHALDYNPSLGAAEAQARSAEEGGKSALAELFPSFSTTYGYAYSRQNREPGGQMTTRLPSRGTYTWNVQVSQILFDGFRNLGTYQKQALQAESDKAALRQSELYVTGQVQQTFISYLCARENAASQRENAARLRDQVEITTAFHDVGLRPRLDVLQAQVDLGDAERALITAENEAETALARLNALLGLPVTEKVRYEGALVTRRFERSLEECLETASRLRPDLYVGYKAVEMAVKDRLIARSGYYPQVEAYYSITNTGNTPGLQRGGDNSSRSTTWEAGASLSWEVFQWGTTYFSDQQAGWLVAKARSQARGLLLDAGSAVKEKFLALREAGRRIEVARRNLGHAREAYDAALASYREQVGTNFDVLDASSKLLAAQAALTAARGDWLTALSALYVEMGEFHPDLL